MKRLSLLIVVLAAVATGAALAGAGPFQSDAEPTGPPEIESFEITDRGCQDDIRKFSSSSSGTNGTEFGTIDTATPETELSAQIRRTSPESAAITTYRIDLRTHETTTANETCPGRIAYRIEYDTHASDDTVGHRVALTVDGRTVSCGGATSGPDLGCGRLMTEPTTHWSNESDAGA